MKRLSFPLIVLNFKTYLEATGEKAVKLAKIADEVSEETGAAVAVAPQYTDLARVAAEVNIPVFAQHVDPVRPGSHTGAVLAEAVREAGAVGSLVNHSERQQRLSDIRECIQRLRENGLVPLVCAGDALASAAAAALEPEIVAVEPPELIGTGIPVSKAKPEIVRDTITNIRRITDRVHILCGAGITTAEDVEAAIKLGTEGVLLASAYVKAKDPKRLLMQMAEKI